MSYGNDGKRQEAEMNRGEKVQAFRALHVPGVPLVMPNPWDIGSAKLLVALGAKAIATTSSGYAFTLGIPDGGAMDRATAINHAATLAAAVDVPVSGDFENGYGDDPEVVAETVRLAAAAGLAGVSIEDIALPAEDAYPFDLAVARIEAAVSAALDVDIVLTARADGWLRRSYDQDEAVRRCEAFAAAGAEVIYAPVVDEATTRRLTAIGPAVNVLAAPPMLDRPVSEIGAMGAARISIGGSLARVTHRVIVDAARAMLDDGDLRRLKATIGAAELSALIDG
jgi:2-methylisocitrate lyase-like PEP mutase family enzyme